MLDEATSPRSRSRAFSYFPSVAEKFAGVAFCEREGVIELRSVRDCVSPPSDRYPRPLSARGKLKMARSDSLSARPAFPARERGHICMGDVREKCAPFHVAEKNDRVHGAARLLLAAH